LYKKFGMTKDEAEANIAIVREFSKLIDIPGTLRVVIEDPEDDKFVETALVAGAQWLVSGDKHLLRLGDYRGLKVISARAFLDLLAE
jgi:predicted nucleic acid-binding protein